MKVNRCLTEGRQALAVQLAGIEGGIECGRLAPLLSALAHGEATAAQLAVLRPHMNTCLACRARLQELWAALSRVAALLPASLLGAFAAGGGPTKPGEAEAPDSLAGEPPDAVAGEGLDSVAGEALDSAAGTAHGTLQALIGALQQRAEALLGATQHKVATLAERAHAAAELVAGQR